MAILCLLEEFVLLAVLAHLLKESEFASVVDSFFNVLVPSDHNQNQQNNKWTNDNIPDPDPETEYFDACEDDALSGCGTASQKLSIQLEELQMDSTPLYHLSWIQRMQWKRYSSRPFLLQALAKSLVWRLKISLFRVVVTSGFRSPKDPAINIGSFWQ